MKGIPNKIYLQVDPDNEKPEFFGELEGITWSVNKINKNDVSYYRKDNNVKPVCDWLTMEELKILESELRVADPTLNKMLTKKQEDKLFDTYNKLIDKLAEEILRRENCKSV